jgi:hypothetical protein
MAIDKSTTRPRRIRRRGLRGAGNAGLQTSNRRRRDVRPTLRGAGTTDQPLAASRPEAATTVWRSEVAVLSGLNVLAGVWLIIAPWVLGYSARDPRWNDVLFGIVVGLVALVRATGGYREQWVTVVNALAGVWLFVAAFTIDHTTAATWNDIILGVIVFVLALSSAGIATQRLPRLRSVPATDDERRR